MTEPSPALRGALVADHVELYMRNAWFHQGVDALARFLPLLVEGLALQAEEQNKRLQASVAAMERAGREHL